MRAKAASNGSKMIPAAWVPSGPLPNSTLSAGVAALAIADIAPSPSNPRKSFSDDSLAELAASITEKGVLEPIMVRPVANAMAARVFRYELVFGERRLRAAKLAGHTRIPAIVRGLNDQQVLEIQVVENEQREDVPVLEKAAGYARLVKEFNVTVEALAARIGKSVSTVRGLLRLPGLPPIALKSLEQGQLAASTALLLARIPGEAARRRAAIRTVCGDDFYVREDDGPEAEKEAEERVKTGWPSLSFRETKEMIERDFMVELKAAPFSRKALDLVPAAGSCDACPKRTGNDREAFPDARADVCTDPDCYRAKCEAHKAQLVAKASASGKTVITGEAADKILPWGIRPRDHSYVSPLDQENRDGEPLQTLRKLIGKELEPHAVLVETRDGELVELYPRDKADEALKALGIKPSASANGHSTPDDSWQRQQKANRKKQEARRAAAGKACELVYEKVRANAAALTGWKQGSVALFAAVAKGVAHAVWEDGRRLVARRHGCQGDVREAVAGLIAAAPQIAELFGLMAELVASQPASGWANLYIGPDDAADKAFWAAFGVDKAALVAEAEAEQRRKAAARREGKKKLRPKAKAAAGEAK
jgi:ParB/RepB/Spo0J family partition protein